MDDPKEDCLLHPRNQWKNARFHYDDLGQALVSLFVMSSLDGWVVMMHQAVDGVGVDLQPRPNYNQLRVLYFVAFLLMVGFVILNMFVGVLVENFYKTSERMKKEAMKKHLKDNRKSFRRKTTIRKMTKIGTVCPRLDALSQWSVVSVSGLCCAAIWKAKNRENAPLSQTGMGTIETIDTSDNVGPVRGAVLKVVRHTWFDAAVIVVIILFVITMSITHYGMSAQMEMALNFAYVAFTIIFTIEAGLKIFAYTFRGYIADNWNKLDFGIVILSLVSMMLDQALLFEQQAIPVNPAILRILRVTRIARGILLYIKLLKNAKGVYALINTVAESLPQVGNLALLFSLVSFIFAALGVELFGRLECSVENPCDGLDEHAHFKDFGMAFLTLFRVATGDNWSGIMKDTLRTNCDSSMSCQTNCCASAVLATIYFVLFVLLAQFILLNVVVAMLMKGFEESKIDLDTDTEDDIGEDQINPESDTSDNMGIELSNTNKPTSSVFDEEDAL